MHVFVNIIYTNESKQNWVSHAICILMNNKNYNDFKSKKII